MCRRIPRLRRGEKGWARSRRESRCQRGDQLFARRKRASPPGERSTKRTGFFCGPWFTTSSGTVDGHTKGNWPPACGRGLKNGGKELTQRAQRARSSQRREEEGERNWRGENRRREPGATGSSGSAGW